MEILSFVLLDSLKLCKIELYVCGWPLSPSSPLTQHSMKPGQDITSLEIINQVLGKWENLDPPSSYVNTRTVPGLQCAQGWGDVIAPPMQPLIPVHHPATPPCTRIAPFRSNSSTRAGGGERAWTFTCYYASPRPAPIILATLHSTPLWSMHSPGPKQFTYPSLGMV